MPEPQVDLNSVSVRFDGRTVLKNITWRVLGNERWVILGRNGCGKTTLLRTISMYNHPTKGSVEVLGGTWGRTDIRQLRHRIGLVSTAMADLFRPEISAFDLVLAARHGALETWWDDYSEEDRARAMTQLETMGVGHLASHGFETLSSGERQRVQMARVLMTEPQLLLFDEPAAGLDLTAREELLEHMTALAKQSISRAQILVTHHLEEIPNGFTHAMLLKDGGQIASGPIVEVLTSNNLSNCFDLSLDVHQNSGRWSAMFAQ